MSGDDNPQNPQFAASAVKGKPNQGETQQGTGAAAAAAPAKKKQKNASAKRK